MKDPKQNPGCFAVLLERLGVRSKQNEFSVTYLPVSAETEDLPYRVRDDFLSPAEHSFYLVLITVLGDQFTICPKVSLADIFFVTHPEENISAYNRINRKHIDFLVCDPKTMRPCFAVELDDRSHSRPDREERDSFVDNAFEATGLPLIRIPARNGYSAAELNVLLEPAIHPYTENNDIDQRQLETASSTEAPTCPKCGAKMVLRTARSGAQAGKKFYGCPSFPKCRTIVPYGER